MNDNFLNLGVIDDPRSDEEKAKDWQHEEIAGAVPLKWVEKPQNKWRSYDLRDQDGSSSCVSQASAKAFEILDEKNIVYSAHPIYRRRMNYPDGGMYLQNAGDIAKNGGTTTEALDPSQHLNETNMNRDIIVDTPAKIAGYVNINYRDIDAVAEAIEAHGHCVMIFHGNRKEWTDIPKYNPALPVDIGHSICAVDYFLYNGEKVILIEDSWGRATTMGNGGQRLITAEYLNNRFSGGIYFLPAAPAPTRRSLWNFEKPLTYGMRNSEDVVALQNALKYEGLFPAAIASSGNYLTITAKAVLAFQRKYSVAPEIELAALAGKVVGPKTRAKLNELYGK